MISIFPSRAVALEFFGFDVHWYGIMYLLGFLLAYALLPRLQHERNLSLSKNDWANILSLVVVGVIAGGRLGFFLFYEPRTFLTNPLEILQVWHGGMSSHGGFIGVTLALVYAIRHWNIPARALVDVVVVPAALGLGLGRLGNFINQELYGTATSLPWGIVIPGVEGLRHPTQLYAFVKDMFIAGVCFAHLRYVRPVRPGRTCALFLILYAVLRFLVEHFREQTYPLTPILGLSLTRGQMMSIPVFIAGIVLLFWWNKTSKQ